MIMIEGKNNENLPDKQLIKTALLRGMYLFNKYSGAKQASALIDVNSSLAVKKTISITLAEIEKHIGITIKPISISPNKSAASSSKFSLTIISTTLNHHHKTQHPPFKKTIMFKTFL